MYKNARMKNIMKFAVLSAVIVTIFQACSINYTLSGASIPENAKTFSVNYFPNQAAYVNPNLSQTFTEYAKQFFARQTRLELVERNGDFLFEGEIVDYNVTPMAITGDATAAETRLTIKINVRFYNRLDPEQDFEEVFSAYEDFEASQSIINVQDELVDLIIQQISENVFNKAFSDW